VIAAGDSYNDTSMLLAADAGILFRPAANVVAEFPQFPVTRDYAELRARVQPRRRANCDREELAPILRRAQEEPPDGRSCASCANPERSFAARRRHARGSRQSDDRLRRGRRDRPRHLEGIRARVRRRRREGLQGQEKDRWFEVLAGEKAFERTKNWLPDETVAKFRECLVGIKGPLTTPIGGGIRSLNVALRQMLDLYVCLRPVALVPGRASPVSAPSWSTW